MEGTDITLITWGAMLQPTLQAAALMEKRGINPEIIDLRTLSPLDMQTVIESVEKTHKAVVVHEAPASCGVGAEVIARINEKALVHLEAPVAGGHRIRHRHASAKTGEVLSAQRRKSR